MKNKKIKLNEIDFKNINIETILGLYYNYKEIINYLIFGVLCTIINFVSYFVCAEIFKIEEITSNSIAWFFSVLFAYFTNKAFVFESKTGTKKEFFKEIMYFFLARIVSGLLCDIAIFAIMIKILKINDIVAKIITQIIIIVTNYAFSKLFVFRKKDIKLK